MTEAERRLKAQLDANSAAIARMQRQVQAPAQPDPYQEEEVYDAPPNGDPYGQPNIDQDQLIMQAIAQKATQDAVKQITQNESLTKDYQKRVKGRMARLVEDFPALSEEGSELVSKSRQVYARIARENPTLDQATRYELAVREAAAAIGARPTSTPPEDADWTMGPGANPALPSKTSRSRLTPYIVANARLMGINVDPKTADGKRNLKELSEYSARFNADVDESSSRYK